MYLSGLKKKTMVGKGVFLTRKETRARLGRIEVGGGENSKWMGRKRKRASAVCRPNIRDCEEEFVKGSSRDPIKEKRDPLNHVGI